jgi:hypothetical protein
MPAVALQAVVVLSERARKVLAEIATFSPEERAELADELWRSLPWDEAEAAPLTDDVITGRTDLLPMEGRARPDPRGA